LNRWTADERVTFVRCRFREAEGELELLGCTKLAHPFNRDYLASHSPALSTHARSREHRRWLRRCPL